MRSAKKHAAAVCIFTMAMFCLVAPPIFAEVHPDTTVTTTEGTAPVHGTDYAGARNQAINDAVKNAVIHATETLLSPGTMISQNPHSNHALAETARNYISEYRILDEKIEGDSYGVTLLSTVRTGAIKRALENTKTSSSGMPGVESMKKGGTESTVVFLKIKGIGSYTQYRAVKRFLTQEMPCVTAARERSFQQGSVEFEIHATITTDSFAEELAFAEIPEVPLFVRNRTDISIDVDVIR